MIVWKDEDQLWEYLVPRMRGTWRKLEASYPDGLTDSFGLWNGQTHWLEHKVGKPSIDVLRPKQREFAMDCRDRTVPWYVCFGWRGTVHFFDWHGLLTGRSVIPPFWVPPSVALRLPALTVSS